MPITYGLQTTKFLFFLFIHFKKSFQYHERSDGQKEENDVFQVMHDLGKPSSQKIA